MGGGGGSTRTTSTTEIPEEFRPFFVRLFERSEDASQQIQPTAFPGARIAPLDPLQQESLRLSEQSARSLPDISGPLFNLGIRTTRGDFLDPATNPFIRGVIEASSRPVLEQFHRQVLPSIRSAAITQGAFGGNRQDISEGIAASGTSQALGDIASQIVYSNFLQERQNQMNAPALLDAAVQFSQLQPTLLGQAGDVRRQLAQDMIEANRQRFAEEQQAPFLPLFPLASIIQGGNLGQTTTTTLPGGGPSRVASGITGALGGGALGAGTSAALTAAGVANPGLLPLLLGGALLGGAGGALQ